MGTVDWVIILVYLAGMIGMSALLARGQTNAEDYYVGSRGLPWWAIAISTMATQTSANSFIGIPAAMALEGRGWNWLQYEMAVPLAMIFVMIFLIPLFRELKLVSVYEYLELRFDRTTRKTMSAVFLISRGLATGVTVYASGVVLAVCLGIPIWACMLIIGVATIIYDTLGGMAAVVYSDVIQMVVLLVGVVVCVVVAVDLAGGVSAVASGIDPAQLEGLDMRWGVSDSSKVPFWGLLVGGFVLYVSYYGVDQSQAQRELSAPTMADTKRSLVFNGIARFPLTILYLIMGFAIAAALASSPEMQDAVGSDKNRLVPVFVLRELPYGLKGLVFAAILAASMSSLDSTLNSLSAATIKDFIEPRGTFTDKELLGWSKVTTVGWGLAITGFAFLLGGTDSVVEMINKVGSVFYGPLLAGFLVGILDRKSVGFWMIAGIVGGVAVNIGLMQGLEDQTLFWMWLNLSGLVVSVLVTTIGSRLSGTTPQASKLEGTMLTFGSIREREKEWIGTYSILLIYFVSIVAVAYFGPQIFGALR